MRKLVEEAIKEIADEYKTDYVDGMYNAFWPLSFKPEEADEFVKSVSDKILFSEYTSALINIHE